MTPADRQRLARILGMLGSEFDGERASAALQAEAFRKKHGLTWAELLALKPVEEEPRWTPPPAAPARYQPAWPFRDRAVMGFGAVWAACAVFVCVWQNI